MKICVMQVATVRSAVFFSYPGATVFGTDVYKRQLEWKIKGLSGRDIADLYGVQPNTVGAWISRAAVKLREDERVLTWKC